MSTEARGPARDIAHRQRGRRQHGRRRRAGGRQVAPAPGQATHGGHDGHGAGRPRVADPLPALHQRRRHGGPRLHERALPLGGRRQGNGVLPARPRVQDAADVMALDRYAHDPGPGAEGVRGGLSQPPPPRSRLPHARGTAGKGQGRQHRVRELDGPGHGGLGPDQAAAAGPWSPNRLPPGVGRHEHDRARAEVDRGRVLGLAAVGAHQGQGLQQGGDPRQRLPGPDL
jgi:hypothetical protein